MHYQSRLACPLQAFCTALASIEPSVFWINSWYNRTLHGKWWCIDDAQVLFRTTHGIETDPSRWRLNCTMRTLELNQTVGGVVIRFGDVHHSCTVWQKYIASFLFICNVWFHFCKMEFANYASSTSYGFKQWSEILSTNNQIFTRQHHIHNMWD